MLAATALFSQRGYHALAHPGGERRVGFRIVRWLKVLLVLVRGLRALDVGTAIEVGNDEVQSPVCIHIRGADTARAGQFQNPRQRQGRDIHKEAIAQ